MDFFLYSSEGDLPPGVVRVPPFPDDNILFQACLPRNDEWGTYQSPEPTELSTNNILTIAHNAGDFTLAHRDTWKVLRGYRESGGVAW